MPFCFDIYTEIQLPRFNDNKNSGNNNPTVTEKNGNIKRMGRFLVYGVVITLIKIIIVFNKRDKTIWYWALNVLFIILIHIASSAGEKRRIAAQGRLREQSKYSALAVTR